MNLSLNVEERNDWAVFRVTGRMMTEADSQTFRRALEKEIEGGRHGIVVDCSGVTGISSAGLGALIAAHRSVTEKGGQFKLVNLSPKVRTILDITRLNTVFDIADSWQDPLKMTDGG